MASVRLEEHVRVGVAPHAALGPGAAPGDVRSDEATRVLVQSFRLGVLGARELVRFPAAPHVYAARIDTGATTSSLHADSIEPFERDGAAWVRFRLIGRGGQRPVPLERPVSRRVRIKKQGGPSETRYVVELPFVIGTRTLVREFSLSDRTDFEFAVLIGRNVLHGMAVVDVSRADLAGRPVRSDREQPDEQRTVDQAGEIP